MCCQNFHPRSAAPICAACSLEMTKPEIGPPRRLTSDAIRYLAIAIVGLVTDLAIALALRRTIGLPLPVATAIGFLSAVTLNYVLLDRFLFARATLSWARLAKTYMSAQGALIIRVLSSWTLSYTLHGSIEADAAVLTLSAGLSFAANFFIVRLLLR